MKKSIFSKTIILLLKRKGCIRMVKQKITKLAYDLMCKSLLDAYDIIPDEVTASNEEYMNIENKKRSATQRKDGRFMAPYTDKEGKRKFKYGKTPEEAIQKAIDEEKKIVDQKNYADFSFESCYKRWFLLKCRQAKRGKLKYSTVDRIERTYIKYYQDTEFVQGDIRNWTEKTLVDFLIDTIDKEDGFTRKNWLKVLQIVKDSLDYAYEQANLAHEPFVSFCWPTVVHAVERECNVSLESETQKNITKEEHEKLHDAITSNARPAKPVNSKGILANKNLGTRRGEFVALRWDHVDFTNKTVFIEFGECQHFMRDEKGNRVGKTVYNISSPKTKKSKRTIPLTKEAEKALLEIRDIQIANGWYRDDQFVLYEGVDYKSRSNAFASTITSLCHAAGIRELSNHMFRKALATDLRTDNTPANVITDILGHTSIKTTDAHYVLPSELDIMRAHLQSVEDNKTSKV